MRREWSVYVGRYLIQVSSTQIKSAGGSVTTGELPPAHTANSILIRPPSRLPFPSRSRPAARTPTPPVPASELPLAPREVRAAPCPALPATRHRRMTFPRLTTLRLRGWAVEKRVGGGAWGLRGATGPARMRRGPGLLACTPPPSPAIRFSRSLPSLHLFPLPPTPTAASSLLTLPPPAGVMCSSV